eukprot:9260806-Pyramimonas_sp.AAC.1
MQTQPLRPSEELLYGATKRERVFLNWVWRAHANAGIWAGGGAPYGATKRVSATPRCARRAHANVACGAFGGAS